MVCQDKSYVPDADIEVFVEEFEELFERTVQLRPPTTVTDFVNQADFKLGVWMEYKGLSCASVDRQLGLRMLAEMEGLLCGESHENHRKAIEIV